MSAKANNSDRRDDEVTLASSPATGAPNAAGHSIVDDESTAHDTTTHERRRHEVKPLHGAATTRDDASLRPRVRTLRSAGVPKARSRRILVALAACAVGALIAWRTMGPRARPAAPTPPSPTASTTPPAESAASPIPKLTLDVHVEPSEARVSIDGSAIDKTKGVELELPCPRGFHELRVEAKDHEAVVKRIPCEGRVVMDISLDER